MNLPRTISALIPTCLLMAAMVCSTAFAAQISGIEVEVANAKDGHGGELLLDNDPATAWIGGGRSVGPGKWIELTFPAPVALERLDIRNGYQKAGKFDTQRRVTRGFIKYPDDSTQQFTIKPTSGVQSIRLHPKTVDSLKIVILGVAPSSKDKNMGKAKVAISEVAVYGEMGEAPPVVVTDDAAPADPEQEPKATAAPKKAKPEPKSEPKAEPAKAAPAPRPEPKKEEVRKAATAPEKTEPEPKPEPKPAEATPRKDTAPAPEKSAPVKKKAAKPKPQATPKKAAAPAKPKAAKPQKTARPASTGTASTPGIAALKSAVLVPEGDTPMGRISPWINLELVAQVKRYFALLTTLHDSYPDVFIKEILDREKREFIAFQNEMRADDSFGQHHMAQLDHMGLSFDKPVIGDDVATVHVHGPYRYYLGNVAYEFNVDADFGFMVEDGKWKIAEVKAR